MTFESKFKLVHFPNKFQIVPRIMQSGCLSWLGLAWVKKKFKKFSRDKGTLRTAILTVKYILF